MVLKPLWISLLGPDYQWILQYRKGDHIEGTMYCSYIVVIVNAILVSLCSDNHRSWIVSWAWCQYVCHSLITSLRFGEPCLTLMRTQELLQIWPDCHTGCQCNTILVLIVGWSFFFYLISFVCPLQCCFVSTSLLIFNWFYHHSVAIHDNFWEHYDHFEHGQEHREPVTFDMITQGSLWF